MRPIHRSAAGAVRKSDDKARELTVVIANGNVDRFHHTSIDVGGVDMKAYRKNPVVLWSHGGDPHRGSVPIGNAVEVRVDGGRLIARVKFASDPFAAKLLSFYRDGTLNGWEVSLLPYDASKPSAAEIRSNKSLAKAETIIRRSELLAISACGVPSNSACLTLDEADRPAIRSMVSRGLFVHPEIRSQLDPPRDPRTSRPLPPLGKTRSLAEVEAEAIRAVEAWRRSMREQIEIVFREMRDRSR